MKNISTAPKSMATLCTEMPSRGVLQGVRAGLRWVASCSWWKGMTRLWEVGQEGGRKDELEPVRASRRILRCPQRGQPPARRDVRWSWPSTIRPDGAGYG